MTNKKLIIHNDAAALNRSLVSRWQLIAQQAIADHGAFHVALAGGSTPRQLYLDLAEKNISASLPWQQTHVYFGDERCVAPDHEDSNYHMALNAMLKHVPIPKENIHRISGEKLDHTGAADDYHQILSQHLPQDKDGVHFDLILLGLGPDGHIASLFPDTNILAIRDQLAAAVYVEKFDSWRISITFPVIEQARHVLLAAVGDGKANIINQLLNTDLTENFNYPVQKISQLIEWHLDNKAAAQLPADLHSSKNDYYDQNSGC